MIQDDPPHILVYLWILHIFIKCGHRDLKEIWQEDFMINSFSAKMKEKIRKIMKCMSIQSK